MAARGSDKTILAVSRRTHICVSLRGRRLRPCMDSTVNDLWTTALAPAGPADQDAFPILNIVVPHSATFAASGRPPVLHRHRLAVLDLATLSTPHAVSGHWNRPLFLTSQRHAGGISVQRPRHRSIETGALHGLAYLVARIRRRRSFVPRLSRGVLGTFQERERPSASPSRPI